MGTTRKQEQRALDNSTLPVDRFTPASTSTAPPVTGSQNAELFESDPSEKSTTTKRTPRRIIPVPDDETGQRNLIVDNFGNNNSNLSSSNTQDNNNATLSRLEANLAGNQLLSVQTARSVTKVTAQLPQFQIWHPTREMEMSKLFFIYPRLIKAILKCGLTRLGGYLRKII